jgi:hypothetical protein
MKTILLNILLPAIVGAAVTKLMLWRDARARQEAQHFERCPECGQMFDKRSLDETMFHCAGHIPREATGIIGHAVNPIPIRNPQLGKGEK